MSGEGNPIFDALTATEAQLNTANTSIQQILKTENARLLTKQQTIINAQFGQNRIIDLNRDEMKRTLAYTKVGILTALSLGIILLLHLLGDTIPDTVMTLIYVMLLSACLLYGIFVYTDVNGREATNYDRYNIPAPVINPSDEEKAKLADTAAKSGDLLAANDSAVCSGQGCCDINQAYNSSSNKCIECTGTTPNYYAATQSCGTACTGTDNYYKATQSCGPACTGATPKYNTTTKTCEACTGATPKYNTTTKACEA